MRRTIATIAIATAACSGLSGCRSASPSHASATATPAPAASRAPLTSLAAGDALGLALHEHYVMVATLKGDTKPVVVTRK